MMSKTVFSFVVLALAVFSGQGLFAASDAHMEWFTEARFGMFIHFGAYSLPARHEWVKNYEGLTDEDYQKYVDNFDPWYDFTAFDDSSFKDTFKVTEDWRGVELMKLTSRFPSSRSC